MTYHLLFNLLINVGIRNYLTRNEIFSSHSELTPSSSLVTGHGDDQEHMELRLSSQEVELAR